MDSYFVYIVNKIDAIRHSDDDDDDDNNAILRELRNVGLWRAVLAELVATLLFVLMSTMSAMVLGPSGVTDTQLYNKLTNGTFTLVTIAVNDGPAKIVVISLTFGFMITVCIQMFGHVSGGHMNPAVSIALAVDRHVSPTRALFYVIAQCAGGILGSLILKGVTPTRLHDNLGLTQIHSDLDPLQGVVCEIIYTFILVMSILGCTDADRPMFGSPAVGIGLTVAAIHLTAIPFTGSSINPARSLAVSIVCNSYTHHWVYWVGPIVGGIMASLSYKYIFSPYKGIMSYDAAADRLLQASDILPVPLKLLSDLQHRPINSPKSKKEISQFPVESCCSHL